MTRTKQFVGLAVLATLSWWAVAGTAHAQVTTADVVGRVTDASGGALPGRDRDAHQSGHRGNPHAGHQ